MGIYVPLQEGDPGQPGNGESWGKVSPAASVAGVWFALLLGAHVVHVPATSAGVH